VEVDHVWLPKHRLAKMASDHLPLVADLRIRF
jgi:endonuclease/exonuclease/phosphatase family metal-dependent hydrolase